MDKNDWMHMDHVGAENNHGAGAQDLWAIVQLHANNTWLLYFKIYILGYSTQCHMIYVILVRARMSYFHENSQCLSPA